MLADDRTQVRCAWRAVGARRRAHRPLSGGFQLLEEKTLLAANVLLPTGLYDAGAATISPAWFADYSDADTPSHVNPPSLAADLASGNADLWKSDDMQYDWIVRFDTQSLQGLATVAQTGALLVGGGIEFEVIRGLGLVGQVMVRSSEASLKSVQQWLAANSHLASWELDVSRQLQARPLQIMPNDPSTSSLWGLNNTGQTGGTSDADIDAPEAWDISTGSSSIVVGVIDTGVDYTHPDLVANIWTNPGEIAGNRIDDDGNGFVDDVHGYDFANNDGDPMDDNEHGTHVAGTIAAKGDNGVGVVGVNWTSSIMALKFLSGSGSGSTSDGVRAINYATMMRTQYGVNVRVTNNSWGGGRYSSSMYDAIAAHNNAGILFVAAAGNSNSNNDSSPHYPSNYDLPGVIGVAATDHNDNLASFSSYGATSVDLAAPGVSIRSTIPGNGYANFRGTSMATPHVSGVAALAWSVAPAATVAEIRAAILQGTDSLASLAGKVATGGRLNALNTLQAIEGGGGPQVPLISGLSASPNPVGMGENVTLTAQQVTDADGSIERVQFYRDANGNGQIDEADQFLGTDFQVVNGGDATLAVSTSGLAAGNHVFLARALDNDSQWSRAAGTTLTVTMPDRHGDDAQSGTPIGEGNSLQGEIQTASDVDWFKFQAIAGRTYKFNTQLVGLADSVLYLFGRDGSKQLAHNDDVSWPNDLSSGITWQAPVTGTYHLKVTNFYTEAGTYLLKVNEVGTAHDEMVSTPGLYDGSTAGFHLRETNDRNDRAMAAPAFCFGPGGNRGWTPLHGDWNGDGIDTIGLYDPYGAGFHLKNINGNPPENRGADVIFRLGPGRNAGWQPLVGDFDGDGVDSIGLYDPSGGAFHLKNSNSDGGGADVILRFGPADNQNWTPLVGDWDGDGVDTVGLYDSSTATFRLRANNNPADGSLAVAAFNFGPAGAGWMAIVDDWNGSGYDTIGLYDPSSAGFHLKNINGNPQGNRGADVYLTFGPGRNAGWRPLTGNWDGVSQAGLSTSGAAAADPGGRISGGGGLDPLAVDRTVGSHQLPSTLTEEDFQYAASGSAGQHSGSQRDAAVAALDALLGDELPLS